MNRSARSRPQRTAPEHPDPTLGSVGKASTSSGSVEELRGAPLHHSRQLPFSQRTHPKSSVETQNSEEFFVVTSPNFRVLNEPYLALESRQKIPKNLLTKPRTWRCSSGTRLHLLIDSVSSEEPTETIAVNS
jgi:hypothetical protein